MPEKAKRAKREEQKASPLVRISVGAAVGTGLFFILIAAMALLSLKAGLDSRMYLPCALAAGAVSGIAAGFTAVKPIKKKGILFGGAAGLITSAISAAVSVTVSGEASVKLLIIIAVITVCSALGGILAANLRKRVSY